MYTSIISCQLFTKKKRKKEEYDHALHVKIPEGGRVPDHRKLEFYEEVRVILDTLKKNPGELYRPEPHLPLFSTTKKGVIIFPIKRTFTPIETLTPEEISHKTHQELCAIERLEAARLGGQHALQMDIPLLRIRFNNTNAIPCSALVVNHFLYQGIKSNDPKVDRALRLEGGYICLLLKKSF